MNTSTTTPIIDNLDVEMIRTASINVGELKKRHRINILKILADSGQWMTVNDIISALHENHIKVTQSEVSTALIGLRRVHVVKGVKSGKEHLHHINWTGVEHYAKSINHLANGKFS